MKFNSVPWSEVSYQTVRKETENILKETFKIDNIEGRYFIFIKSYFFYKYKVNNINSEITLWNSKDEVVNKSYKYKIRQPYPNKNWYLTSMKYGRRLVDDGFIFMFDNFEELSDTSKVIIKWDIDSEYDDKSQCKVKVEIKYNTKFLKGNDNVYSIKSHDTIQELATPNSILRDYDKQFDINNYNESDGLLTEYHEQTLELIADNSRANIV